MGRESALLYKLLSVQLPEKVQSVLIELFGLCNEVEFDFVLALLLNQKQKAKLSEQEFYDFVKNETNLPDWILQESIDFAANKVEALALAFNVAEGEGVSVLKLYFDLEKANCVLNRTTYPVESMTFLDRVVFAKLICSKLRFRLDLEAVFKALAQRFSCSVAEASYSYSLWQNGAASFSEILAKSNLSIFPSDRKEEVVLVAKLRNKFASSCTDFLVNYKLNGYQSILVKQGAQIYLQLQNEICFDISSTNIGLELKDFEADFAFQGCLQLAANSRLDLELQSLISKLKSGKDAFQFQVNDVLLFTDISKKSTKIERQNSLENFFQKQVFQSVFLVENHVFENWTEVETYRKNASKSNAFGISVTSKNAVLKDFNYFLKADFFEIKAALMYVQKAGIMEDGVYSQFTFGVYTQQELIPIAKLSEGVKESDNQIIEDFVPKNTLDKIGPVKVLQPDLVGIIQFEDIVPSTRHKAKFKLINPVLKSIAKQSIRYNADTLKKVELMFNSKK